MEGELKSEEVKCLSIGWEINLPCTKESFGLKAGAVGT